MREKFAVKSQLRHTKKANIFSLNYFLEADAVPGSHIEIPQPQQLGPLPDDRPIGSTELELEPEPSIFVDSGKNLKTKKSSLRYRNLS